MEMVCRFQVRGTIIDNVFIDQLMPDAPGDYLKVYLYLLRHQTEKPEIGSIADALNHTEADVRRALRYWEQMGALVEDSGQPPKEAGTGSSKTRQRDKEGRDSTKFRDVPSTRGVALDDLWKIAETDTGNRRAGQQDDSPGAGRERPDRRTEEEAGQVIARVPGRLEGREAVQVSGTQKSVQPGADTVPAAGVSVRKPSQQASRPVYSQEQVNRLSEDEDFAQLLYIAQKYMNKAFTPRECEVFAYLYDGLHMSQELLEYLVEHCVQGGHTSIRYIETVGLNWHEKGLRTVEEAKAYASGFTKDSFAVMRAFGLSDRRPGDSEKQMISRWFSTYGFTRELVIEACNRTLEATHSPSFRYADKILSEWKKAGVRNLTDVSALDQKRQNRRTAQPVKAKANQFHNFEQRDTDYDSMVLDQVKSWIGGK